MDRIDRRTLERFESAMLPHLDSAHNLARWMTGDEHDAVDVVQESMVRALRGFHGYHGGDARSWLLTIVRNTGATWLRRNRSGAAASLPDDAADQIASTAPEPPALAIRAATAQRLRQAIEDLPSEFREVFVLRELEGLSYKEIAQVAGLPMGTVMSRLARARQRLAEVLSAAPELAGG